MNLDWSVPLWMLPPEVGEAEDSQAYGHLGREEGEMIHAGILVYGVLTQVAKPT